LVVDGSTLAWWAKQSDDARRVFNDPSALPLPDALDAWLYWLDSVNAVRLWGNGANFDQPVLNAALRACGKLSPIAFWNERCLRTLKAAVPGVATPEFTGTKHHAMDDALHEAVLLNRLQTALRQQQQQQQHPQEGGREA
jgi:exodeoxyribonuclease VIII